MNPNAPNTHPTPLRPAWIRCRVGSLTTALLALLALLVCTPALRAQHEDPAKQDEHMALLDLLPPEQATVTAQSNGSWFDDATWSTGQVPGTNAKVHIPSDVTVTYNGAADTRLRIVRVDGTLRFNRFVHTEMVVDTLFTTPGSTLEIGTADNPINDDRSARIVIGPVYPSQGSIDTNWDWHQLSRGVVTHGTVRIHGEVKSTFHRVTVDPRAGDTSVTVLGSPTNWEPGDEIVITGTRHVRDSGLNQDRTWNGTEDEVRIITSVSGNTVSFSDPLDYDHPGAGSDITGQPLRAYVANLTRNVVIETEDPENTPTQERGHVMFMHNPDVDVRYAQFHELGRTDKSTYLDDFLVDENGHRILDADGNPQPGPRTNIRGRYSFHFHRTGAMDATEAPAVAWGNAVIGGPGWGFVHHDSNADFFENVSFDVFAAHFVTETGNELGRWERNIAIRSRALGNGTVHGVKDAQGYNNHDNGRPGVGFWFQGRVVTCKDNVAAGQRRVGFAYLLRGVDQLNVLAAALDFPQIANGRDTLRPDIPEIHGFVDNETLASEVGLVVIKSNSNQQHEVRSLLDAFSAWNVRYGFQTEYTSHYTFRDLTLIGDTSHPGDPKGRTGAEFAQALFDMYIFNAVISDFDEGFYYADRNQANRIPDWAEENIGLIDVEFTDCNTDIEHDFDNDPSDDGNEEPIEILSSNRLSGQPLTIIEDSYPAITSDGNIYVKGTILDSLGHKRYEDRFSKFELEWIAERDGYYTLDGAPVVAHEDVLMDRADGGTVINTYLIDVTDYPEVVSTAPFNGDWGSLPPPNGPPSATVDAPSAATVGVPVTIHLTANDSDGVSAIDLIENSVALGAATQGSGDSWSFEWTPPHEGVFEIQARAQDTLGKQSLSMPDTVTVSAAPPSGGNPVVDPSFDGTFRNAGSWAFSTDAANVGTGWLKGGNDSKWNLVADPLDPANTVASADNSGVPGIAQIIPDGGATTGLQNIALRASNIGGFNQLVVAVWGIDGEFKANLWDTDAPVALDGGTVREILAPTDIADAQMTWDTRVEFPADLHDINFGDGYEYLFVQIFTQGVSGNEEQIVDDFVIGAELEDPAPDPDPAPEPSGSILETFDWADGLGGTFNGTPATATGADGLQWTYQRAVEDDAKSITGVSLILQRRMSETTTGWIEAPLPAAITGFKLTLRPRFHGKSQIRVTVDGVSFDSVIADGHTDTRTMDETVSAPAGATLRIESIGNPDGSWKDVLIDDLELIGSEGGGSDPNPDPAPGSATLDFGDLASAAPAPSLSTTDANGTVWTFDALDGRKVEIITELDGPTMAAQGNGTEFTFARQDAAPFDLSTLEVFNQIWGSATYTLTGTTSTGDTLTRTVSLDGRSSATLALDWAGLTSVHVDNAAGNGRLALDDLQVSY